MSMDKFMNQNSNMKKSAIITLIVGVVLGIVVYRLSWTVIQPKLEHRVSQIGLTENEKAANGPLPGDASLYQTEFAACQKIPTPGYFPTLCGAEAGDAQRSCLFPCANFTGSWDGPNKVFAWLAEDSYPACTFIINGKPGELFIVGGDNPPFTGPAHAGPYIAKADATTGKQIWRTYVDNLNASGRWIGAANLNLLANGKIAFAWANQIVLIDPDTGRILKQNTLPTGDCPVGDANYKHLTVAPDGTLILKDQTRPIGNTMQGTLAIIKGVQAGQKQPNSHLCAVDPNTLQVLDDISLPEPATVPHSIAMYEGKIAIYIGTDSGCRRAFWDPARKNFRWTTPGMSRRCRRVRPRRTRPACSATGWCCKSTVSAARSRHRVSSSPMCMIPKTCTSSSRSVSSRRANGVSCMPKSCTDPENNMIYSADMGISKIAGIKIDPATGDLKTVFVLDNMSNTFQPLFGPKDKRILVLTNMKKNVAAEPNDVALFTQNYKEQVTWNDAATGRQLAASDFFEPLTINSLIPPGFGGRWYFPMAKGFMVLQVMPAPAAQQSK